MCTLQSNINKVVATTYFPHHYYIYLAISIWPDPVSTSQVDCDLVVEVTEVGVKLRSHLSKILVWEVFL